MNGDGVRETLGRRIIEVSMNLSKHLPDRGLVLLRVGGEVAVLREIDVLQQLIDRPAGFLAGRYLLP